METLVYLRERFNLNLSARCPIEIPNIGRDNLGEMFRDLGFKKGVELGVERGVFSETLCKGNPDMWLYGVDAWQPYRGYRDHVSPEKLVKFKQITLQRMRPYKFSAINEFSMNALNMFDDGELDFVYIDANHEFLQVASDIYHWSKKVRLGGIVAGHDYRQNKRFKTTNHVVYVVDSFMRSFRVKPWFLLGTKEIIPGEIRDKARSWMYVKKNLWP